MAKSIDISSVFKYAKILEEMRRSSGPANNNGRHSCWWCGTKTEKILGFTTEYNICPKCKR
jgi:hypothetical protein